MTGYLTYLTKSETAVSLWLDNFVDMRTNADTEGSSTHTHRRLTTIIAAHLE